MPRMLVHASSQTWPGIWLMAVGGNVVWLPRSLLKRKQRRFSSVQWLRLHLLMMGCGFNPRSGSWDPTCLIAKKLHHKTETICNKFSKDLKKTHIKNFLKKWSREVLLIFLSPAVQNTSIITVASGSILDSEAAVMMGRRAEKNLEN